MTVEYTERGHKLQFPFVNEYSVDPKIPAEAAPTPPFRGHGSPLCSEHWIY